MRMACGMTTRRSTWPGREADGAGGLLLALGNALDAGADDLGDEGAGVDDEAQISAMSSGRMTMPPSKLKPRSFG